MLHTQAMEREGSAESMKSEKGGGLFFFSKKMVG